jgi:protein TonB
LPLQSSAQVYRADDPGVVLPKVIRDVKPQYTAEALRARIDGEVVMEAVVLETGRVGDVEVTKSLDTTYGLDDEAVKALRQWRFEPGRRDGKAVSVLVTVWMTFTLRE